MKVLNSKEIQAILKNERIDYFISSASFEKRCFGLCSLLNAFVFQRVLIFGTIDFDKKIEENRKEIVDCFKINSVEVLPVDLKLNNPEFSFIQIAQKCNNLFIEGPKVLLLDITTFTHEYLLIIFRLLLVHRRPEDKILLAYVGAGKYASNIEKNKEKWLTKGVKDLRSIIGFPGYSDPSKKNHLIVLFGFEKERTIKLIEEFDFELVSLAFGSKNDSINSQHQKINEERHSEILELFSTARKFEISLTDPYLTKNQILSYVSGFNDHNIVIAPMNNKISTIGAGMAAIECPDIQLCYLQANIYNVDAYAEMGDEFYLTNI